MFKPSSCIMSSAVNGEVSPQSAHESIFNRLIN